MCWVVEDRSGYSLVDVDMMMLIYYIRFFAAKHWLVVCIVVSILFVCLSLLGLVS